MASNVGTLVGILVVVGIAIIFLPRIMAQVKGSGFSLSNIFGTAGANGANGGSVMMQGQQLNNNTTGTNYTKTTCNNGDCDIQVKGNGCACANGVCKGNCSDMEQIDLENFDPLEWVQQQM